MYDGEIDLEESHSGRFEVSLDGDLIFSKMEKSRFPEEGEVEELLKNILN